MPAPKETINHFTKKLAKKFWKTFDVKTLLPARSNYIDQLVIDFAQQSQFDIEKISIIATGGYGRGELHPYSDIDLLILHSEKADDNTIKVIELFIQQLWSTGLAISHHVNSIPNALQLAAEDIKTYTSFMEARLIFGNNQLFQEFQQKINARNVWPNKAFFLAKIEELKQRHHQFNDTIYNLEPNIKKGPGSIRDIQTLLWSIQRFFSYQEAIENTEKLNINNDELKRLHDIKTFLWKVRYALHLLAGRAEERLLFDYQPEIAKRFGYQTKNSYSNQAVEAFMQDYYQQVQELTRITQYAFQCLTEQLAFKQCNKTIINNDFFHINGLLDIQDKNLFEKQPEKLLAIFKLTTNNTNTRGFSSHLLQTIQANKNKLQHNHSKLIKQEFLDILRHNNAFEILNHMHQQGVLAEYLLPFKLIVGHMQYDLFHAYTVDQHILFVIKQLNFLFNKASKKSSPLAYQLANNISNPLYLHIAALFHDIAKGRDGDHSELGYKDADEFCLEHDIVHGKTKLITWLVKNHLLMSLTAQKKDIADPVIIDEFVGCIPNQEHLDHLYLLTIADINATNPTLWNSWKDQLLKDLYLVSSNYLSTATTKNAEQNPYDELLKTTSKQFDISKKLIKALWSTYPTDYFRQHEAKDISRHTTEIINNNKLPIIMVTTLAKRQCTEIFIYTNDQTNLFARATNVIGKYNLNIVAARIYNTIDHHTLDTFYVLNNANQPLEDRFQTTEIQQALNNELSRSRKITTITTRIIPRREKHFTHKLSIHFTTRDNETTKMELICTDQPGLLSLIGNAFTQCHIQLHHAKIATFGNRVEDTFMISNTQNQALKQKETEQLKQTIVEQLTQHS